MAKFLTGTSSSLEASGSTPTVTLTLPLNVLSANCVPEGRYFLAEIILVISSVASSTLRELSAIRISDTLSSTLLRPAIVIVSGTLTTLPVVR